jgi:hypothetical protein
MNGRSKATGRTALPKLWHRWTAVVKQFARKKRSRHRLSGLAYRALHQDLLRVCRCLADAADEQGRIFYGDLGSLAQPWLSPSILEKADRKDLFDLLERCRQVERALDTRTEVRLVHICAWLGLALAAAVVCFVLLDWFGDRGWDSLRRQVNQELRALRWAIGSVDRRWFWLGGSGLAALITIGLVVRAIRS